jgi:hypothetical protein
VAPARTSVRAVVPDADRRKSRSSIAGRILDARDFVVQSNCSR